MSTLLLPRLLHPFKKFPAKLVPTFPITVPSAEAATLFPKSPKSRLMNLSLTSSSVISSFPLPLSPPSILDWDSGAEPLSPNFTSCDKMIGKKSNDASEMNFIFVILSA